MFKQPSKCLINESLFGTLIINIPQFLKQQSEHLKRNKLLKMNLQQPRENHPGTQNKEPVIESFKIILGGFLHFH